MNLEAIQQRLAVLQPLQDADGQPLLDAVLSAYQDTCHNALTRMELALTTGDLSAVKQSAHTLGGAAATLGMQAIFDQCKVVQVQAKRQKAEDCRQSLTELSALCGQANALLRQARREIEGLIDDSEGV